MDDNTLPDDKSKILKALGGGSAIASIAGCQGQQQQVEDETTTDAGTTTDTNTTTTPPPENSAEVTLTVNDEEMSFTANPETPLLYVLRNDAGLKGPKFGCGLSQCGACTVLLDGTTIRSCVTPLAQAEGSEVLTPGGLGTKDDPHPLQQAFIDEQAAQCGYCISGMMMTGMELLNENPDPSREEIISALDGNLCRCGTHSRIISAVELAAENMGES